MSTIMKNRKIKFLIILMVVLLSINVRGQQDPQFTHYMYNMSVINLACATDNPDVMNIEDYIDHNGLELLGPVTGTFFAHKPLSKRVEMGVSFVHDEIGDGE